MSILRPGMVIGVPITNGGSQAERSDGHFGIYLGDFQVAHDTGKVEVTSLGDFIARSGNTPHVTEAEEVVAPPLVLLASRLEFRFELRFKLRLELCHLI